MLNVSTATRASLLKKSSIRPTFVTPRKPADNLIKRRKNSSNLSVQIRRGAEKKKNKKYWLPFPANIVQATGNRYPSPPLRIMRAKFDRSLTYRRVKAKLNCEIWKIRYRRIR